MTYPSALLVVIIIAAVMAGGCSTLAPQSQTSQASSGGPANGPVSPSSGEAGALVPVTITGTNFSFGPAPSVWLAKAGEADIMAADVNVLSPARLTCTFPLTGSSVTAGEHDVLVRNSDQSAGVKAGVFTIIDEVPSPMIWTWSDAKGWDGWQHSYSCSGVGSKPGSCLEYGPLVTDRHGMYGTNVTYDRVQTEARVSKTFTAPSGKRWRTLTFTGQFSPTPVPFARWITIDVNGVRVYSGTAADGTIGNARPFTISGSFPPSNDVTVLISNGQDPTYGTTMYVLQYDSLTLR
jgi:hypothetical protein